MRNPTRQPRSKLVRRSLRPVLLALLTLPLPVPVAATEDEQTRWVPSFGVFFDMLGQKGEGSISTGDVMGEPLTIGGCEITDFRGTRRTGALCPMSPSQLTPDTAGDDTGVVPLVGGSLELMTPRLLEAALGPRLFAHADAAAAFGFERNLAGERDPGPFFTDPLDPSENDVAERAVAGQGSRAKVQVRRLVIGAGAGVAFTTRIFDRTVRLKPSFEYLRQEVDLLGSVHRAVKLNQPASDLTDFRVIRLRASSEETLHGLGGGLEIEADSGRLGPAVVSLFLMGRGYRMTGNLRHTLTDTNESGETATWRFELDPWAWRAGVGMRLRWVPE